jgi:outer membrane autotransporter protein
MNTLNMGADGTIEFDLPAPTGGDEEIGTYPQVFVDTANLDGTIVANIEAPANGLWETTTYQNVIDAVTRNGTFDTCTINGVPTGSLLLDADCIYDNAANVDIGVVRTAFNEVPGLNQNGEQVGEGLECIYDLSLTGGVAEMFADLFLFDNAVNYNTALNMLSGSSYANYLNSFASLGVHQNDLVDHATNCEIPALAGSVLECRASSPIHIWGQVDYQTRKADGDIEAGDSRSKRFTGLIGLDANVGNAAILGLDAGYLTNRFRDHQFGDSIKGDGWTVGAYGVYDPGAFFVKGMATYANLNGDSTRHIDFAGLAPGATFAATVHGDPDVKMYTLGLHGGARFPMSASSVVTPYLNLDYVHAKMDGFIEQGTSGAELHLDSNSDSHTFLTGGVKWATQMGGVVPEVNVGYRYRFGNERSRIGAYFNGDVDCDFDIVSAAQKRGNFLAGLSVGGKLGPVDVRIGYEGEFNGDVVSHSGNFKFVLPIGGHAAPPPPPPVAAPPPPPPPVAAPPPPPPPPPAPMPPSRPRKQGRN